MRSMTKWAAILLLITFSGLVTGCFDSGTVEEDDDDVEVREEGSKAGDGKKALRTRVKELEAEKKALSAELASIQKASKKGTNLVEEEIKWSRDLEATRAYLGGLDELEAHLDQSLEAWRNATRESFKGVRIPEITTVGGVKYVNATIVKVTDSSLAITHEAGEAEIPALDLPVGLRKNMIHEPTVLSEKPQ
ncbi:MAG TPA: hypothetical protein PLA50_17655 [Bacteroidia bacterium]|nr:hypothetical protein [Bacteroidia bacterium]